MARETESSRKKTEEDQSEDASPQPGQPATQQGGQQQGQQASQQSGQPGGQGGQNGQAGAADENRQQSQSDSHGDGFAQLREHHRTLRALLGECANITDADDAEGVLPRLSDAWAKQAEAYRVLYDASTQAGLQEFPLLTEIAVETDLVSFLLGRARRDLEGPLELAGLRVAVRLIGEIMEREEKPRSGLLAKAKAAGVDSAALGRRIRACMTALSDRDGEMRPQLRHLTANQEDIMPRNSNMPERDDRGRFVSDDDNGGRGGSGGRGSSRSDDRDRDSRGRFMSDRDDDRYSSRGRSSRRDDDDRRSYSSRGRDDDDRGYSRDRGQGGWFGDPEGHSEASRRGWDHRRDDDDDDRRSSRGRR